MTPLLSAIDLSLIRGSRCLFKGIEFALNAGELLLVEGSNGSGKTSLLKSVAGLCLLETGEVRWQGQAVARDWQQFRSTLVWLSHRTGLKGDLTPVENLRYEAGLRAFREEDLLAALDKVQVRHCARLPVRSLSAGQQRRVGLARMLLAAAPLWIMDEPFTNLDTAGQTLVAELLTAHLDGGGICILASHQAMPVNAVTQRVRL